MCTPRTIRDWTTCFFPCRFPLDEEPDTFCSSSAQVSRGAVVFNSTMGDNRSRELTSRKAFGDTKCRGEKETVRSRTQTSNASLDGKGIDKSSWPGFADEDYIVFCFREDGAIHAVKDGKPEASDQLDRDNTSSARPVNRKLVYCENAEELHNTSHDHKLDEHERNIYPTNVCNKKETKECKMVSAAESSDSNQSDGSSSSFAFPVLSWEGVGSPVQMPRPDTRQLRKHKKTRAVRLLCRRF